MRCHQNRFSKIIKTNQIELKMHQSIEETERNRSTVFPALHGPFQSGPTGSPAAGAKIFLDPKYKLFVSAFIKNEKMVSDWGNKICPNRARSARERVFRAQCVDPVVPCHAMRILFCKMVGK